MSQPHPASARSNSSNKRSPSPGTGSNAGSSGWPRGGGGRRGGSGRRGGGGPQRSHSRGGGGGSFSNSNSSYTTSEQTHKDPNNNSGSSFHSNPNSPNHPTSSGGRAGGGGRAGSRGGRGGWNSPTAPKRGPQPVAGTDTANNLETNSNNSNNNANNTSYSAGKTKRGRSGSEDESGGPFANGGGGTPRHHHQRRTDGFWRQAGGNHHHHGNTNNNNNNNKKSKNKKRSNSQHNINQQQQGLPNSRQGSIRSVHISDPIRAPFAANDSGTDDPHLGDTTTFFPNPSPHTDGTNAANRKTTRNAQVNTDSRNMQNNSNSESSGDDDERTNNNVGFDDDDDEHSSDHAPRYLPNERQRLMNAVGGERRKVKMQTTGTTMTPQTIRPRRNNTNNGRSSTGDYWGSASLSMPTPDGVSPLQDPTVFVSPYVRLVAEGDDPSTTIRTLESLLKYGTANIGREDDTPFLAPVAEPSAAAGGGMSHAALAAFAASGGANAMGFSATDVSAMLKLNNSIDVVDLGGTFGSDDDEVALVANHSIGYPSGMSCSVSQKPPSPGLHFSLDGVATPNTWGAIHESGANGPGGFGLSVPQSISLPPATDPHTGHSADFSSGLSINKTISTPESSMYRFLMNDYCRETDTFGYRSTPPQVKAKFMQRITDLCAKVTSIMERECLMCAVATPVYVLGDIHGNFCDLSYFLKGVLAFNDIHLSPCNVLCLGDYVDRGPYSLECVLLLFALKATAPAKVTLLRGNHEDRVVCGDKRTYGNDCFLAQCQAIFGQVDGMTVFIMITEVFRHLPLAAEIVISNAPNNPQAPRDLADEDDWESVPTTAMGSPEGGTSDLISPGGEVMGLGACSSGGEANSPNASASNLNLNAQATSSTESSVDNKPNLTGTPSAGNNITGSNNSSGVPKTPKNAFRVEQTSQRDVRKMFTDRNWLRRQTHVERILCTHGGIPRFSCPPKEADSLAFLRSPSFPRLLTLFPNNPLMREYQPVEVERFRNVSEEVMQRAWFTMFDLMWSDPTVDDSNVNEWGFGINTRGNTVVSFSAKAVEMFLDAYKYSMLFRAHQEKAHGIRLSKSKKVLTIFSTSNYLGHGNGAGCAVVSPYGEVQLIVKTSE